MKSVNVGFLFPNRISIICRAGDQKENYFLNHLKKRLKNQSTCNNLLIDKIFNFALLHFLFSWISGLTTYFSFRTFIFYIYWTISRHSFLIDSERLSPLLYFFFQKCASPALYALWAGAQRWVVRPRIERASSFDLSSLSFLEFYFFNEVVLTLKNFFNNDPAAIAKRTLTLSSISSSYTSKANCSTIADIRQYLYQAISLIEVTALDRNFGLRPVTRCLFSCHNQISCYSPTRMYW